MWSRNIEGAAQREATDFFGSFGQEPPSSPPRGAGAEDDMDDIALDGPSAASEVLEC